MVGASTRIVIVGIESTYIIRIAVIGASRRKTLSPASDHYKGAAGGFFTKL